MAMVAHLSEVSGSGLALVHAARGLEGGRIQAVLVLPDDGPLVARARSCGVEPVIVANPQRSMAAAGAWDRIRLAGARVRYVIRLAGFLRRWRADLVYANTTASVFSGLAARLAGARIVWHVHETLDLPTRATRLKMWLIERLSNGLLYDSQSGMDCFPAPRVPLHMVVRNCVDVGVFRGGDPDPNILSALGVAPGDAMIFSNGVIRRKGPDTLLEAAAILKARNPRPLKVVMMGLPAPGEDEFFRALQERAARPDLAGTVVFAGLRDDAPSILRSAAVFVSPSRNEALPIAMLEAMAAGVPVVATDVGDCSITLDQEKRGFIVPPENPQELARAIAAVLADPEAARNRAEAARDFMIREYGSADFWKPLESFLCKALER